MAYSDFTITDLQKQFHLVIEEVPNLFGHVPEVKLPERLMQSLERYLPFAVSSNTEKARSESLIAPLLMEFRLLHAKRVSLFSGIEFNVDAGKGLNGRCDYILALSPLQLQLTAPVCVLVEAKNENMVAGIPQCLAEMVAAQQFNRKAEWEHPIHGIVSTGELWRFMKLDGLTASVDMLQYPIQLPEKIFGILTAIALN